jgi:hypothetical protein
MDLFYHSEKRHKKSGVTPHFQLDFAKNCATPILPTSPTTAALVSSCVRAEKAEEKCHVRLLCDVTLWKDKLTIQRATSQRRRT